ncbi:D-glycero-beta-D-manno-heptose-7-phosphate kinase, partial [bacterium]
MTPRELLAAFPGRRVVVIGDLMLDEYVHGRATRISQEAPVMVVRQGRFEAVPGGAANVAANLSALGADVALAGVVGDDEPGVRLQTALEERGTSRLALVKDRGRPTTRKTRILADAAHQVLRVDHESDHPLAPTPE